MARKTGFTINTPSRLVIDAGAVYKNYLTGGELLLGATRGGSVFEITQEQRSMPFDGIFGDVMGNKRLIKQTATLKVKFIETSKAVLIAALANVTVSDYPSTPAKTHDKFIGNPTIAAGDYLTNVAIVVNPTGSSTNFFYAILKNSLSAGKLSMTFVDANESEIEVTFTAHFDPAAIETAPWEIYNPNIA